MTTPDFLSKKIDRSQVARYLDSSFFSGGWRCRSFERKGFFVLHQEKAPLTCVKDAQNKKDAGQTNRIHIEC